MRKKIIASLVFTFIIFIIGLFGTLDAKNTVKSIDGVPIVYETFGKGDVALVFVHCWCCDRSFWDAQVPYFSKKYQVVTLDLAGHGDSGLERDKWTMTAFGEDVAVVINELKLKKIILIGHSMGGPVVAEAARNLQDKVVGLIAVDTLSNIEQKPPKAQRDMFMKPMRDNFAAGTRGFLEMMMFTPHTDPTLKKRIVDSMIEGPANVGLGAMEGMFEQDLPKVLEEAKVNVRCINADKYAFQNNEEAGKRHTKSFSITFIKDVGHFLHMEKPDEFNRLMDQAVTELLKL